MSNSIKIKLTQIENPERIYIKFLDGEKAAKNDGAMRQINAIQKKISKISVKSKRIKNPTINNIYGCHIESWKKWVRGRVISEQNNGYKLFCIDHGHYKNNVTEFVEIEESMKIMIPGAFSIASLGLKPNNMFGWSEKAINYCKELDKKKKSCDIHFVPIYEESNIFVGDLFVFDGDNRYSVTEQLTSLGVAEKSNSDFSNIFDKMHDKSIGPIKNVKQQKRLETYEPQTSQHVEYNKPKNMILYGNNLIRALSESDLQHNVQWKMSNKSLNEIKKQIWPQIGNNKHCVIISSEQQCLTSLYLQPLLSDIICNNSRRKTSQYFGPKLIIFASELSIVNQIAKKCREYAKDLNIIEAVGMCKKEKIDLLNGCEILIATPSAFIRLVDVSINIIDGYRLKWIVFDNFDPNALQQFDHQISAIMKNQYKIKDKLPQTIITSKTHAINSKILNYLPKNDIVLCIEDFLNAASYVGLLISMEIAFKNEEKLEKLLKSGLDNFQKTVIVVSDVETACILENELSLVNLNALCCDNLDIAKVWDESSTNRCILIITDNILSTSTIKNADNIVHYDLPANTHGIFDETLFSSRFKIFRNAIYKKLNGSDETASLKTKIILSNEDVGQFGNLINFLVVRNLLKANDNVVKNFYDKAEAIKCEKGVALCSSLLIFGKCGKVNCIHRHKLSEQDKPQKYLEPFNNFIKFNLISIQGPTTFVIKIQEFYDNNKWISCVQSNENIQHKLDYNMQTYCMEMKNSLTLNEGKMGEIYAKYDNNFGKWIRGKMIKRISSNMIALRLIDHPSENIPAIETSLKKLPDDLANLNPLVSKLQIMNLVPLDGEKSYSNNDVEKLREYIEKIPRKAVLTTKIHGAIGDIMFARNIEAQNKNKSIVFQLTSAHTKLGISDIDDNFSIKILKSISSITKTTDGKDDKTLTVSKIVKRKQKQVNKDVPKSDLENGEAVKHWKQLKFDSSYAIIVGHYTSPYSFFVIHDNPTNLTLKNALKQIEYSKDHKPLNDVNVNDYCLLDLNDRKVRVKILSTREYDICEVLLVDYGDIEKCSKDKLFEIPEKFLNYQFQAIHCSMLGVRPKFNMLSFPNLQRSAIYHLISEYNGKSLKMSVIKKDEKNHQFSHIGISSYEVYLYDDETKCYLNKMAVERGIASECAQYSRDYHDSTTDDEDYDSLIETSSLSTDKSTTREDKDDHYIVHNLESMLKVYNERVQAEISNYTNEIETQDLTSTSAIDSESSSQSTKNLAFRPSLRSMYKSPYIQWRQNKFVIHMSISAKDCSEYGLKINECSVEVIIKYHEGVERERAVIHLYGSVIPKLCSHELAGNNVTLRLVKKWSIIWSRLTMAQEKTQFIKYDNEKVQYIYFDRDEDLQGNSQVQPFLMDDSTSNDESNSNDFKDFSSDEEFQ